MKIELKTVSKDELEHLVYIDKWREKYRIKEGEFVGELRPASMHLQAKDRAERTLYFAKLAKNQILQIQDYEQRKFYYRFMAIFEMDDLLGTYTKLPRLKTEDYNYLFDFHKNHIPKITDDPELSDGMNFQHAWDWNAWASAGKIILPSTKLENEQSTKHRLK